MKKLMTLAPFIIAIMLVATVNDLRADGTTAIRGLVDFVGQGQDDLRFLNTVNTADSNFDPLRARLFIDGARDNTQVHIQFLLSQMSRSQTRLFGAYLLHRIFDDREIYAEVGLVPGHVGIWAANTYSDKNPLISVPLAYFWKSNLHSRQMPTDIDQMLAARGQGQTGIAYADSNGLRGTPYGTATVLYDNCWNYGAFSLGAVGNFEFAAGITYGTPGVPVASTDTNDNFALNGKVGYVVAPGWKAWVSGSTGAYLADDVIAYLPEGKTPNDYRQTLLGVSSDWKWQNLHAMGEVFFNHFDTPLRDDGLSSRSFYVQGAYTLYTGWELAARYDEIRYERIAGSGEEISWDRDVARIETGVVYRISRDLRLKAVVQATDIGTGYGDNVIPAGQLTFSF